MSLIVILFAATSCLPMVDCRLLFPGCEARCFTHSLSFTDINTHTHTKHTHTDTQTQTHTHKQTKTHTHTHTHTNKHTHKHTTVHTPCLSRISTCLLYSTNSISLFGMRKQQKEVELLDRMYFLLLASLIGPSVRHQS